MGTKVSGVVWDCMVVAGIEDGADYIKQKQTSPGWRRL